MADRSLRSRNVAMQGQAPAQKRAADNSGPKRARKRPSLPVVSWADDASTTNPHSELLLQGVANLYETGAASDCTLISRDGKEFAVHKVLLGIWSSVFAKIFSTDMKEKATGVCRIVNFDGKVIDALLKYMYTGSVAGIGEFVKDALVMADQYIIGNGAFAAACGQFLVENVTVSDAPESLVLAKQLGLGDSAKKLVRFIAEHVDEF